MSDLRTLPTIIAHAEAEARVRQDGLANRWPSIEDCPPPTWASMAPAERQFLIDVELDLACDLSRPASMDAVARLVAAKVGLVCGATAPDLARFACGEHCCDGERGRMVPCSRPIWSMMAADETQMVTFADCPDPNEWDGDERCHVPGISAITDPAEALRLIATHVLRSPDV